MKAKLIILLLMISSSVQARYLTPIIDIQSEGDYVGSSLLTESKLFYQTKKNDTYYFWSMDLATHNKVLLRSGNAYQSVRSIQEHQGLVYFSARDDHFKYHLWYTDGSPVNTQQVSTEPLGFNGQFVIKSNQLFSSTEHNQLIQLQNGQLVKRPVTITTLKHICVLGEDNLIVQTGSEATRNYTLKRIQNNTVSSVYQYSSYNNYQAGFTAIQNSCYFQYLGFDDRHMIKINKQGYASPFVQPADIPKVHGLFSHLNRVYALSGEGFASNKIYRLTTDLMSYDASVTISDRYSFSTPTSSNQLLVAVATQNQFEPFSQFVVLDKDLNFIPHYYQFFQNSYDRAHTVGSDVIFGVDVFSAKTILERFNQDMELEILSIENYGFRHIISNSEHFYLVLRNNTINQTNIYALTDQPNITAQINGSWIEPDIINQGLMVQHGQRQDGSHYVFGTLYVIDDGLPLWLAGSSEVDVEQAQLNLEIFTYDGLELFETNASPNRTPFGQLQLEMITCDQLTATITSAEHNLSLNLYRVDDASFDHLCADIQPLTLDQPLAQVRALEVDHE